MSDPPLNTDADPPVPPTPPRHAFSPLSKIGWTVIGLCAAAGIFLIGLFSSGGASCKDNSGNATSCRSGGHGGGSYGGTSSSSTARGGFGGAGEGHGGGGE